MAVTDFHDWMQNNNKEIDIQENGRRTGIRSVYPALYGRGNYTDSENRTKAADAAYYQSLGEKKGKKKKK